MFVLYNNSDLIMEFKLIFLKYNKKEENMDKKQELILSRIIFSTLMLLGLNLVYISPKIKICLYMGVYLIIGYDVIIKALKGIFKGKIFDENFLMTVATVGAFCLSIYENSGECNESVAVMLFYQIGELFQDYAVEKSRKNISKLMDIRPDYANMKKEGKILKISPYDVPVGSEIIVNPGEKIPIEGIITEGNSSLNTSALTGESIPCEVKFGDEVISGCINITGVLKIRTTKAFGDSTVSKILKLVEESDSRKSKSENFISKFAKIYTPIVCITALLIAVIPPLFNLLLSQMPSWNDWIYRALTFLVISCPCALVVSVPLSFFAGIGGAGKDGILIKGANFIELLSMTRTIIFDKTGTLTKGTFEVEGIHHNKLENEIILEYAALAESSSSHPISKSIQRAYGKEIDISRVTNVKEMSGHGVISDVDGVKVAVGNNQLMEQMNIDYPSCHSSGTIIHVALDGKYAGHIVISDSEKSTSKEAISELKKLGIKKTIMLTGDSEKVAEKVSKNLLIDEFHGDMLPEDKATEVEKILKRNDCGGKLAFVGDGINDAPALSRADVGIAMGALGSDAAIEAADVVLMDDNPIKISKAIKISKKCLSIVRQNISLAIIVKFVCLILSLTNMIDMWVAVFADVGVTVIAILNAIRALYVKNL